MSAYSTYSFMKSSLYEFEETRNWVKSSVFVFMFSFFVSPIDRRAHGTAKVFL